jgi:4'-phosphopantetheinyl transferase EntD
VRGRAQGTQIVTGPTASTAVVDLFPGAQVAAFMLHGYGDVSTLFDDEFLCVAGASEVRQREFAAGRSCARAAIRRLGEISRPLVMGRDGHPAWPDGFTGSISHTRTFAVAVVTTTADIGLGIDCEPRSSVSGDLFPILLTAEERGWVDALAEDAQCAVATRIFSAKEAWYKAQHWITHAWADFDAITFSPSRTGIVPKSSTFAGAVEWPPIISSTELDGFVVTGAVVRPRQLPPRE